MEPNAVRFAAAARTLGDAARRQGLLPPSFRSPPRVKDAVRTLLRRADGVVVAVAVHRRPWAAVLSDLVEGVVVANRLDGPAAERARQVLWSAVTPDEPERAA
ncbi:MAG: hypothetical protein ACRD0G_10530 [Acidimicrobiales bacterium]